MLDIKFIRDNVELIKDGARKKRMTVDVDRLIVVDDRRKELQMLMDQKRAQQNSTSEKMPSASPEEKQKLIEEMGEIKEVLKTEEEEMKKVMEEWRSLMVQIPNIPDMTVPEGDSDAENQEAKVWGEKTAFSFTPKTHVELMLMHDMADFERGSKVAGFRGYFLKNDGARLSWAIWRYAQDFFADQKRGLTPMIVPSLVRKEAFFGTGYLPQGEEDLYKTQDGDFLAGTAEVATMGYYMDETLDVSELPKRFIAFSPCFRREAGAHSKDVKGLIRVHEFYKWEQVVICEASHEESVKWHEWVNRNTEEFVETLKIPYHTVVNCGGDLGQGQVKKYDIELWVPGEQKYREISSASYFHDFQTRRLNLRYKDKDGTVRFTHSLNSTAIPTPRILVSLIENFQNEDGSITIPEVLRPYMGKDVIATAQTA